MAASIRHLVALLSLLLLASGSTAQLLALPSCVQKCLNDSGNFQCGSLDIPCICGSASKDENLVGIAKCTKASCTNVDASSYLGPLQIACQLAGYPIPAAKISSASSAYTASATSSSSDSASTTTSSSSGSSTPASASASVTQTGVTIVTYSTATLTTTNPSGSSYLVVVPLVSPSALNATVLSTSMSTSTLSTTSQTTTTSVTTSLSVSTASSASTATRTSTSLSVSTAAPSGPTSTNGGSPFQQQGTGAQNKGNLSAIAVALVFAMLMC